MNTIEDVKKYITKVKERELFLLENKIKGLEKELIENLDKKNELKNLINKNKTLFDEILETDIGEQILYSYCLLNNSDKRLGYWGLLDEKNNNHLELLELFESIFEDNCSSIKYIIIGGDILKFSFSYSNDIEDGKYYDDKKLYVSKIETFLKV